MEYIFSNRVVDMCDDPTSTILVVGENSAFTERCTHWLKGEHTIRTATDGEDAVDQLTRDVDVVLLDHRTPGLSNDAVVAEIRRRELDCRVALIADVDPDTSLVERGFDDYLVAPISKDELHETIDTLLRRVIYDTQLREYFALVANRAAIQANKETNELDETYRDLNARIAELKRQLDDILTEFTDRDFVAVFSTFSRNDNSQQSVSAESGRELVFDIATSIAEKKGVEVNELTPPLADVIDPDALERLLRSSDTVHATFTYDGFKIDIGTDGSVTVTDSAGEPFCVLRDTADQRTDDTVERLSDIGSHSY